MSMLYVAMAGLGLLGAISDATLNQWAESNRTSWLLVSYGLWIAVATVFGFILRADQLSFGIAVIVFLTMNCAAALALDVAVFGGTITGKQWVGVALALGAVTMFELGRSSEA